MISHRGIQIPMKEMRIIVILRNGTIGGHLHSIAEAVRRLWVDLRDNLRAQRHIGLNPIAEVDSGRYRKARASVPDLWLLGTLSKVRSE